MNTTTPPATMLARRLRRMIELHFDPDLGTPFWLDRAASLGLDPREAVHGPDDLHLLGTLTADDLRQRPLLDYLPRRYHRQQEQFIVGQTAGTSGQGVWTAYRLDEFQEAFVLPFIDAADAVGFPRQEAWLYVGPSGPHVIGKAAPRLAHAMGSHDPFSVDFDPRWVKRLPEGSLARQRYTEHVLEQAMAVIDSQEIGVLFTTPPVLAALAQRMTPAQRQRITGVHYGGLALTPAELHDFQARCFPNAVHLSGYGNTLMGCALELSVAAGRTPDYFPHGHRLLFEVLDDQGRSLPPGRRGRLCFTRLDHSMLIVRLVERDEAELVLPPAGAPEGFVLPGVRDPRPFRHELPSLKIGLY